MRHKKNRIKKGSGDRHRPGFGSLSLRERSVCVCEQGVRGYVLNDSFNAQNPSSPAKSKA